MRANIVPPVTVKAKGNNLKTVLDGLFKKLASSANVGIKDLKLPTVDTEVGISPKVIKIGVFAACGLLLYTIFSQSKKRRY